MAAPTEVYQHQRQNEMYYLVPHPLSCLPEPPAYFSPRIPLKRPALTDGIPDDFATWIPLETMPYPLQLRTHAAEGCSHVLSTEHTLITTRQHRSMEAERVIRLYEEHHAGFPQTVDGVEVDYDLHDVYRLQQGDLALMYEWRGFYTALEKEGKLTTVQQADWERREGLITRWEDLLRTVGHALEMTENPAMYWFRNIDEVPF